MLQSNLTSAIYYSQEDSVPSNIFRWKKVEILRLLRKLHRDKPRIEDLRILLNMATTLNSTKIQLRNPHANTGEISELETIQVLALPEQTSVTVT